MKNLSKLNELKKFNVIIDEATEQAILSGMISVTDVLKGYGKECCDWVVIDMNLPNEYTQDEKDFHDKYIHNLLEIGKERDVVIDYVEDKGNITVQIKHKDIWFDFQSSVGFVSEWYGVYLKWSRV